MVLDQKHKESAKRRYGSHHSFTHQGPLHIELQSSDLQSSGDPKGMIRTRTYTIVKVVQISRHSVSILVDKGAVDC